MDALGSPLAPRQIEPSGPATPDLEARVHAELLTVRKSKEGLSPSSMALCPVIRDLLGAGDPLVAFQRLQHHMLMSLQTDDDHRALEAAAYSLGLASKGATHLARLVDFGQERGYEARQARRHSDRGLRQLARMITSHWLVETVPTLSVLVIQDSPASFVITFRAVHLDVIGMHAPTVTTIDAALTETRHPLTLATKKVPASADSVALCAAHTVHTLQSPLRIEAPMPDAPRYVRLQWQGEVWPRMAISLLGGLRPDIQIASEGLGSSLQISLYCNDSKRG